MIHPASPDPKVGRSERMRLGGTSVNAVGLALVGLSILGPLVYPTGIALVWTVAGVFLHGISHYIVS